MTLNELRHRLFLDLRQLSLPVDEVEIFIRPYSKTYYGRYFPTYQGDEVPPKIYIYPYEEDGEFIPYNKILETVVHEFCHHIQYMNGHERIKGVMHDSQFWKLYNHYISRAKYVLGGDYTETEETV